ncbi:MAG TPA: MlaD family protein [Baekduia sp.]|nr:MlaD family protein [Baekduia sp.]
MTVRALRHLTIAAGAAALVAGCGADGGGGRVSAVVAEATNVVEGQDVRQAGVVVGRVTDVEALRGGRAARIEVKLEDRAWPLTDRSRMTLRWGGTANYSNRYIALQRGRGGRELEDGAHLPKGRFVVPVEFDSLLRAFPERVRGRLRGFLDRGGPALDAARPALRDVLDVSPAALTQASAVLHDLDADQQALHAVVRSADRVLGAVDRAEPGMRELLSGAGGTFAALAAEARALQATLDATPPTLVRARSTLARTDRTLVAARDVTRRIAPGVRRVREVAAPVDRLLRTVLDVGPDAKSTVTSLGAAAPDLDALLSRATALSPQLERIGEQAVPNLQCIRPYAPDMMSFFTNWGDFFSAPDAKDKLIRAQVQSFLPAQTNNHPLNAGQLAKIYPGLEYGFPRPPGTNAGQPWFLPECGAGPDALDPDKDPEARPFADVMKIPPLGRRR